MYLWSYGHFPYIGVIIGGGFGLMVLITSYLSVNPNTNIVPIILQFVLVFIIAKLIDDFLMQPLIYSKSVKAKPLEIFLVILMAGKIGGVLGMVLAIPVYTFLRIIAKEFFNKWKFIKALTKEID
jgi:predicted PurR-regulated permease PerM